ncbi:MAG TPA: adenylate/guanylate cyclase domain-containing protein [Pseudomonadota bacterium]|nr:adenylate/guanylate cyclase domain-containing protein [Pseudomonadota bacterium]
MRRLAGLRQLLCLLTCILCLAACGSHRAPPRAQAGVLDLRSWDFERDGMVRLDGDWQWAWERLLPPRALGSAAQSKDPIDTFAFPGIWNGKVVAGKKLPAHGYATFALRILLPAAGSYGIKHKMASAASVLWVNDRILTKAGHVATSPSEYREHGMAQVGYFDATQPVVDLTLQLASFGFFRGGPRAPMLFGTAQQVQRQRERALLGEMALAVCCISIGILQLILFLLRRSERAPLYLGVFCLLYAIWGALQGELILTQLLPQVPYDWMRKLEYVLLSLMTPIFLWFFDSLYPKEVPRAMHGMAYVLFVCFGVTVILTPTHIYTRLLIANQLSTLLMLLYAVVVMVRIVRRGYTDAGLFACGFGAFGAGVVYDIFSIVSQPLSILPASRMSVLVLILLDAVILARKSARAYETIEQQAQALERISRAYYRFVPQAFLQLLGKRDITTVELGDQIQRTMTVLFVDVRGFTALSESMTPEENFTFINRLLRHLGPLIRDHHGFIDKYLGDGIMALFPEQPADALHAACAMRKTLRRFNASRVAGGQASIKIGIGIHTGTLMLGTVGEPERMDGTVIADAVNTASRLESLTKRYGVTILASAEAIEKSGFAEKYPLHIRLIGRVRAKGKTSAVELYEVFDDEAVAASDSRSSLPPSAHSGRAASATSAPSASSFPPSETGSDSADTLRLKQESRGEFSTGLQLFQSGQFAEAQRIFAELASLNPHDRPAAYYAHRCAEFVTHGGPPDWDGIEALTEK